MHQGFLDFRGIVHAAQQNRLVAERDAGFCEADKTIADFGGEFSGMIGMDGDEKRMVLFQHVAEFRRDALGEEDRDAGADPKKLDVRDRAESGEDFIELRIGE